MEKSTLKKLLLGIKIVVTILFVWVVNRSLFSNDTNIQDLISFELLLWASLLSTISIVVQCYRWWIFLKIFGIEITFRNSVKTYLEGLLFAVITPGRFGELFRGYGYSIESEFRKKSSVVVIMERLWSTATLFLMGAVLYFFLPSGVNEYYKWGLLVASVLSLIFFIVSPVLIHKYVPDSLRVKRGLIKATLTTLLIQSILIIQTTGLWLGRLPLSMSESAVASGSAFTGMQFMPVTIANMGVREFNMSLFADLFIPETFNGDTASLIILSTSITIMISNLILPAFPGLILIIFSKISSKYVRK